MTVPCDSDYPTSYVVASKRIKALLSGGIPYLQFELSAFDSQIFCLEVDSKCGNVAKVKSVLGISSDESGLSDSAVAYGDYFDKLIIALIHYFYMLKIYKSSLSPLVD